MSPPRTARRSYDEGFDLVDLASADTILLDCVASLDGTRAYARLRSSGGLA